MVRRLARRKALSILAAAVVALLLGVAAYTSVGNSQSAASSSVVPYTSVASSQSAASSSSASQSGETVTSASLENLTRYVNPFIGTGNAPSPCEAACGGDTFPGADYPMGMVQWSPDTVSNPPGGYSYYDSTITGLSLTHFSGRGCQVYQDFPFMPYVGSVTTSPAANASLYYSAFSHTSEAARPGYYRVHLDGPNVTATLSVTLHTGVGEFVFPPSTSSTIMINAGGSINGNTNSEVSISPADEEVTGSAESTVGCGSNSYVIYFAAKFDRPFSAYGAWDGDEVLKGSAGASGQLTGAFLVFNTTADALVGVQVGISFVSVANAQLNLAAESVGFDLESAATKAAEAWNDILNTVQVEGGTNNETVVFYTALYHVFFHPNVFSDVNGQYLGFDGMVHTVPAGHTQYENINGWDDYRTQVRLLAILDPSAVSDIAQSLVNDAQQGDGSLPRWEQANADSHGMSGDSGDADIAEAYAFGATNFDTSAALQAMINGQSQEREGYAEYATLGYVPADYETGLSSASITLEYANDDFAIAQFANDIGNLTVYQAYLQRSNDWEKVFNNATGYIQPRDANGTWAAGFTPTSDNGFQEGDSAQYTWMVPFNLAGLFSQMGGDSTAVARLGAFFSELNVGPSSPYAWMGNEPSVEVPWEFDFAQAPSQTQEVVRQIETQLWTDSPGGIPGNDDGGEMSSWYVFAAIGLYPEVTAVGGFVIGSPLFTSVTLNLMSGHTIQIDAPQASDSTPYVQALTVDGQATSSLWLPWATIKDGGTLEFSLGSSPSSWGSGPQDAPPSFSAQPLDSGSAG